MSLDVQAALTVPTARPRVGSSWKSSGTRRCSARDPNRPGIARVLEQSRKRNGSLTCGVVVLKLDRLIRSVQDLGSLCDVLRRLYDLDETSNLDLEELANRTSEA